MKPVLLRNLKKGDFFILRNSSNIYDKETDAPVDEKLVFVRDHYDRGIGTYCCHKFNDTCKESFFKGSRVVYVDFIF